MAPTKRGKPLKSQARTIVYSVYLYFVMESKLFPKLNTEEDQKYFQRVQERVAKATGVSSTTVTRIIKESKDVSEAGIFETPKKGGKKKEYRLNLDSFDYTVIRNMIYDFHIRFKEVVTLKSLKIKLFEAIGFQGCLKTLRRIVKDMGFYFAKTESNRCILMEKYEVRLKRIKYLEEIKKLRDSGRNIVFMDESYIHTSHTKNKCWTDKNKKGVKHQISKGQRLIIVHAGNEKGFVPGALILDKCMDSEGDYHREINSDRYQTWLRNQLIPNLPSNSVLVIDNAPYHNSLLIKPPNSNTRKADMVSWLQKHDIPCNSSLTKPEIYETVKQNKSNHTKYAIDQILNEYGHAVIRLPPYHPDFNPIENIWSQIKGYVAKKNVAMNLTSIRILVQEKIDMIGTHEWTAVCNHAIKCEEKYRLDEGLLDENIDNRFVINIGCSDSDTSIGSLDDSDLSDVEMISE